MPKIALPNKGRLSEEVRALLRDAGLDVRLHDERSLVAELGEVSTEDRGSDRDPRGEREPGVAHWPTLADAPLACDCL